MFCCVIVSVHSVQSTLIVDTINKSVHIGCDLCQFFSDKNALLFSRRVFFAKQLTVAVICDVYFCAFPIYSLLFEYAPIDNRHTCASSAHLDRFVCKQLYISMIDQNKCIDSRISYADLYAIHVYTHHVYSINRWNAPSGLNELNQQQHQQ